MESVLEDLYFGNITPDVKIHALDSEFVRMAHEKCRQYEKLTEMLDERQKQHLEAYLDIQARMEDDSRYDRFKSGFKLGVRMMMEVLEES